MVPGMCDGVWATQTVIDRGMFSDVVDCSAFSGGDSEPMFVGRPEKVTSLLVVDETGLELHSATLNQSI